jgi:hypothetical protein
MELTAFQHTVALDWGVQIQKDNSAKILSFD